MVIFRIKNFILDLFFPRTCLGCGVSGTYVCDKCLSGIGYLKNQECPNCRKNNNLGIFCGNKCADGFYFDQLLVCLDYKRGSLFQKLMIRYKYKFSEELSKIFGDILKNCFNEFIDKLPNSKDFSQKEFLIVPVPIHKKKLKKRGFDQVKLLAEYLVENFGIKNFLGGKSNVGFLKNSLCKLQLCECLLRNDYHIEQAKLDRKNRLVNLRGSIGLKEGFEENVREKYVILIDDIATTGSTLNECSRALKEGGAKYVCGLVLGRGK